jgi:peptidoglycan hydrolase-like protein with peptidoglycan-binding domain
MPLTSLLFKDVPQLELASRNSPPLRRGAQGEGVKRLQKALKQLDYPPQNTFDATGEPDGVYGQGTWQAVFDLQRNRLFKNDPRQWDGEAGAKTLEEMDKLLGTATQGGTTLSTQQFPATLKLLVQITELAANDSRTFSNLTDYTGKATLLLDPFGQNLDMLVVTTRIPHQSPIDLFAPFSDAEEVRKAAEKSAPGHANRLRVIFCPFTSRFNNDNGVTFGRYEGLEFDNFCLFNTNKTSNDRCTMLHEMIHATGLKTHDTDPTSVFSESSVSQNRTLLRPEHAERFSKNPPSFFGVRKAP